MLILLVCWFADHSQSGEGLYQIGNRASKTYE